MQTGQRAEVARLLVFLSMDVRCTVSEGMGQEMKLQRTVNLRPRKSPGYWDVGLEIGLFAP